MITLRLWVLEKMTSEVKYLCHHIISRICNITMITVDTDLEHMVKVVFAKSLYCKVTFLPFPHYAFWKEITKHSPHLRSGALCSTSLRVSTKLFGILLHVKSVCSLSFIYSIICLYKYEPMDIYFILRVIIQYYFTYLLVHIIPDCHWEHFSIDSSDIVPYPPPSLYFVF